MYHSVSAGATTPAWPWAVSMAQFKSQLDYLSDNGYLTPTMAELMAAPERFAGRKVAVITFDDGYLDNLYACDSLASRGMRASWFIVAGAIGRDPHWPDDGRPDGRMLNATELRAMRAEGMEIGSHTMNHVRLPEVSYDDAKAELIDSRHILEDALGAPISSFAYPFGAWNDTIADATREAGYAAACTTRTGWALRDNDPYRLRRLTVFNTDTLGSFVRKLAYASHAVSWYELVRYHGGMVARRFTG
ncbi:MAG: polysaccharide deacetylase family protein [Thiobacillus sp.]|nr:polysaccharide deacetylase family protein [Thiobacillus sp.]